MRLKILLGILMFVLFLWGGILTYLQFDLFNYINFKLANANNPLMVLSRTADGIESKFALIDLFPVGGDTPLVYSPRFVDLVELERIQASVIMKQIEKESNIDKNKTKLSIEGTLKENHHENGYVVITDKDGQDWELHDDGSVYPIIYPTPDDRKTKEAKQ